MAGGELGDVEAERADQERLTHFIEAHGMRMAECPACLPGASAGCTTCDGDGYMFTMDLWSACGPGCPAGDVGLTRLVGR
jgi:hypothetical protein